MVALLGVKTIYDASHTHLQTFREWNVFSKAEVTVVSLHFGVQGPVDHWPTTLWTMRDIAHICALNTRLYV